ncbi:MAG TPA: GAF domain-containing sensor histidine kinase [Actinophytocola sp.]|uniref:GAF domain-containing sensor histidine kinase n=1 Tax=Actinophytocola sp. TaxID=1872138 RepID=UPI002DDC9106|nr:GAF domain-containing sensor histidine kinase [Actinophytocola sp.]HEV2778427.1 GAF domain-containing sensor histidine kinase [Actinophytocola sp.]
MLGAAGLVAAIMYKVARPGPDGVLGTLGWIGLGVTPLFVVAVWLSGKRPEHPQTRRLLLLAATLAVGAGLEQPIRDTLASRGPGHWLAWANLFAQYTGLLAMIAAVLLLASYPDGVVERRWQRVVLRLTWLHLLLPPLLLLSSPNLVIDRYLFDPAPQVPSPLAVPWLDWLAPPLQFLAEGFYGGFVVVPVLFVRYFQAGPEQRARMRLLVYVAGTIIPFYVLQNALASAVGQPYPVWLRLFNGLTIVLMLMIPATIVIGIVRHRLFDIDLVVRRSVVYGVLTIGIAVVYIGLAAAPGLAVSDVIPVPLAVLVAVVAAAAFQPLRRRLERLADRLVFGERVNRYQLLTAFGASLEQTVELHDLLPRLAETVRIGLAARWVRVTLPAASAVAGEPSGEPTLRVPLERGGEVIGHIECAKDDGYAGEDRELLATLAGQAATAIANLQLTAALAERVDELDRSRARIITAQDTERRRIERNIHDGAQQQVVALIMKLRLARNQIGRGDRSADEVLDELAADARELLADLRELAHGIHPPVLSDQGLVAAVAARADRLPLEVLVRADSTVDERRLGAEVEGAAYFVICEALTNVVKHSAARTAEVDLSTQDGQLVVHVHDDGVGLATTTTATNGHGLTNLRDRVEALGGRLRVNSEPGAGTSVHAELPVRAEHG